MVLSVGDSHIGDDLATSWHYNAVETRSLHSVYFQRMSRKELLSMLEAEISRLKQALYLLQDGESKPPPISKRGPVSDLQCWRGLRLYPNEWSPLVIVGRWKREAKQERREPCK